MHQRRLLMGLVVTSLAALLVGSCGGGGASNEVQAQNDTSPTEDEGRHLDLKIETIEEDSDASQNFTPIVAEVPHAPIPFAGSDGQTHLVYELETTNFTDGETTIDQLEVLDAGTGDAVATLDAEEVAGRLQPAGLRDAAESLAPSTTARVFLHVTFAEAGEVPDRLVHRLSVEGEALPPDQQPLTEDVGPVEVDRRNVVVIGPPLRGSNYLAADSCCDATRHTRAALPINGRVWIAQRYAVDWEQLDDDGRVYSGEKEDPESYTIYGQEALAVADGTVVKVVDGLSDQVPGTYPEGISIDEADGNAVILDLGGGNYANYAHLQPDSIRVQEGDRVRQGDVLGLVGNSGNSVAPHLHFHVMSSPLFAASNGLPYVVDSFTVSGRSAGTEAFDEAESEGTPLEVTPVDPAERVSEAMPLDQYVVSFA
jgi:Peptidase family M23